MLWVHKECSGITKQLVTDPYYICPRFNGKARPIDGKTLPEIDVVGTMLDMEATCSYRDDMLCSAGGCDNAIATRCSVAWVKFGVWETLASPNHNRPLT